MMAKTADRAMLSRLVDAYEAVHDMDCRFWGL